MTIEGEPRLFTPGPVDVPERIRRALALPVRHHRTRGFAEIMKDVRRRLAWLWQAESWDPLVYTCTGTGSLEAGVVNFMRRDAKAINVSAGKFGERWGEVLRAYGCQVIEEALPWGRVADPNRLADLLDTHPDTRVVYLTSTDTSTGVQHDIPALAEAIRARSDALIVVDCVCDFGGATDIRPLEWDIDAAVSCSQKCLMLPPGLGMATVSPRAWEMHKTADLPRYYFDWTIELTKEKEQSVNAWTSPTSLMRGLQESLTMIEEEGLPQLFARYARLAEAVRQGVQAMGLELFAERPSNGVTAVKAPAGLDVGRFLDWVEDNHGLRMANGQDRIKGKIFRIGNMGVMTERDILDVIYAVEQGLIACGIDVPRGEGVRAAAASMSGTVSARKPVTG